MRVLLPPAKTKPVTSGWCIVSQYNREEPDLLTTTRDEEQRRVEFTTESPTQQANIGVAGDPGSETWKKLAFTALYAHFARSSLSRSRTHAALSIALSLSCLPASLALPLPPPKKKKKTKWDNCEGR